MVRARLKVGSLFSGIGGFDLGLERAGMETRWFCEQEPFCQRVLAKHWPDLPCYSDVTMLRAADVEPVDVLCGGFPCQDLSYAGKGAGIEGSRSGLWSEYARLIGELRPSYVVVENVAALLARGLERVLGDLATLGYDAEWDCIPASALGAPHRRDRLWLVAYPDGPGEPGGTVDARPRRGLMVPVADATDERHKRTGPARHGRPRSSDGGTRGRACGADASGPGLEGKDGRQPTLSELAGRGYWATEPDVGRVADGVPARVDRLRSLGNALVPQIAQWIGERILSWEAHAT